jgi:uncharacterized protein (TIGR03083 family)
MTSPTSTQAPETAAIVATLSELGPDALTSCPGWSAQHIAAHIAGNHEEARRHVEAHLAGRPLTATRSFEEREAPLSALPFDAILPRIDAEEAGLLAAVREVVADDPDAELRWTGRTVQIKSFPAHMRSESAVHRWDLVGDDITATEHLANPELLAHAVRFIGKPLLVKGAARLDGPLTARVRTPGADDLLVDAAPGRDPRLELIGPSGPATVEGDGAARLLLLWGRQPQPFHRLRAVGDPATVARLQVLLAGY